MEEYEQQAQRISRESNSARAGENVDRSQQFHGSALRLLKSLV
jgi:hypothetical protein